MTREVDVLLTVKKHRFSPLQVVVGDPAGLLKLKLDTVSFQALVDSARKDLAAREKQRQ